MTTDPDALQRIRAYTASTNLNVAQVATSTTSGVAVAARQGRQRVILKNIDASITIYVGIGTVTSSNSIPLLAGESIAFNTDDAVNALAASGTPSLAYAEEY